MPILLFDGHCNLCNAWVQYIVKWDSSSTIRFASLQSGAGRRLLEEHKIEENYISVGKQELKKLYDAQAKEAMNKVVQFDKAASENG